jgi:hypothetical protein
MEAKPPPQDLSTTWMVTWQLESLPVCPTPILMPPAWPPKKEGPAAPSPCGRRRLSAEASYSFSCCSSFSMISFALDPPFARKASALATLPLGSFMNIVLASALPKQ